MAQAFASLRRLLALPRPRAGGPARQSELEVEVASPPPAEPAIPAAAGGAVAAAAHMVDASTRTFWRRGAPSTETLVEASGVPRGQTVGQKVAVLLAEQPSGPRAARRVPGPDDPAFVETALVEMLRAGCFDRAFALLAPDCRLAWGSLETFAGENAAAAGSLLGVEVCASRRLPCWEDGEGRVHEAVAELDVDYALATGSRVATVRRTVHLVRAEGAWRSLVYPAPPAHRAA